MRRSLSWFTIGLLALGCHSSAIDGDAGNGDIDANVNQADARIAMCNPAGPGGTAGMVAIAGGTFTMGCTETGAPPTCNDDQQPPHSVQVCPFEIDVTEVTAAAYQACIDAGSCTQPFTGHDPVGFPNYPVSWITWEQAVDYCTFVGKRLPTEAEWEFAAVGATGNLFPWGNGAFDCSRANADNCTTGTEEVGTYPSGATPQGLLDMIGNVAEFVSDWYEPMYYQQSPMVDPQGPSTGILKSVRGGSFSSPGDQVLRATHRDRLEPDTERDNIGFRCAKTNH